MIERETDANRHLIDRPAVFHRHICVIKYAKQFAIQSDNQLKSITISIWISVSETNILLVNGRTPPPVLPLILLFQYLVVLWGPRVRLGRDLPARNEIKLKTTNQKRAGGRRFWLSVVRMCLFFLTFSPWNPKPGAPTGPGIPSGPSLPWEKILTVY